MHGTHVNWDSSNVPTKIILFGIASSRRYAQKCAWAVELKFTHICARDKETTNKILGPRIRKLELSIISTNFEPKSKRL